MSVENPDGKVSNYLHSDINVDDLVEVTVPAGDFTLLKKKAQLFLSVEVLVSPHL